MQSLAEGLLRDLCHTLSGNWVYSWRLGRQVAPLACRKRLSMFRMVLRVHMKGSP